MLKGLTTCLLFIILALAKANAGNTFLGDVSNAKKAKATAWKAKSSIRKKSRKVSHYRKSRHTSRKHVSPSISSFQPQKIRITASTPEEIAMSNSFKKNHGHLPWPVANAKISTHFGRYSIPGTNGIIGDNPGLTFESEEGSPVQAVFEGEVTQVTEIAGDSTIFVKHGKYYTTYSNLVGITVSKGQKVKVGDVLGTVGSDENGKGVLDFILLDTVGSNQDPEKWLAKKNNN